MARTLTRWDPFQDLANMRTVFDRFFEESFPRLVSRNGGDDLSAMSLGVDVYETDDQVVVKAAMPGVDPNDVDIAVEDDVLTIKGETRHEEESREENYLRRELRYGSFHRSLRLPPTVDPDNATAAFEHGMLKLTLPKKPEARARHIKITPNGVIEGERKSA